MTLHLTIRLRPIGTYTAMTDSMFNHVVFEFSRHKLGPIVANNGDWKTMSGKDVVEMT